MRSFFAKLRSNELGQDAPFIGISLCLLGAFCFVVQDSSIKWLTADFVVLQILFVRSLFAIVFLVGGTLAGGSTPFKSLKRPWLMLLRTTLNVVSWCFFFTGLKYLPLATATALFFTFPLMLSALSIPLLGERVGPRRIIAILFGFAGVIFMTNPSEEFEWAFLFMLTAALGWSLVAIITRTLGKTEQASTMLLHTLAGFVILTAIPQFWIWQPMDLGAVTLVALTAFFGVIAQLSLTKAYSVATPSVVAPFEYTGLIWAALFGFLIWGDVPSLPVWIGGAMIMLSGLYILHRESLKGSIENTMAESNEDRP